MEENHGADEGQNTHEIGKWKGRQQREAEREAARQRCKDYQPPELGYVQLADLRIDDRYQRARSEPQVHMLVAKFLPHACQPLSVSVRDDGSRYLVDGQHRAAALEEIGIPGWAAVIYKNLTRRDEAAMWEEMNTRQTKPHPSFRFRAALLRRDPEAVAIDGIVRSAGLKINVILKARFRDAYNKGAARSERL